MKITLLNEKLVHDKSIPVIFPLEPIVIPSDRKGKVVPELEADNSFYATLVYDIRSKSFHVLEFDQEIFDGLAGYKKRHGSLDNVEVLFSRDTQNEIRMTIGRFRLNEKVIDDQLLKQAKEYHHKLYDYYLKKDNYCFFESRE